MIPTLFLLTAIHLLRQIRLYQSSGLGCIPLFVALLLPHSSYLGPCWYFPLNLGPISTRPYFVFVSWIGQPIKFVFVSQGWNLISTIASTLICPRMARLRGRPSEPLMFVRPGRKFVPLILSLRMQLNLWLTHLSINFAKYGLVRIGPRRALSSRHDRFFVQILLKPQNFYWAFFATA